MGKPKNSKIKKKKFKNVDFTKEGFISRLMESGWDMKEAIEEWKRIRKGEY